MIRREFIAAFGSAAMALPVVARAQQPVAPVVGILSSTAAATTSYRVATFRRGLNEAGFVDGRNVALELRFAEGHFDLLPALAADLVDRRVAVIVTDYPSARTAKAATSTIPIVFVAGADPVEGGLVSSLKRPGGNVTGVTFFSAPVIAKRLELLHALLPQSGVVALLMDPSPRSLSAQAQLRDVEAAARALGRQTLLVQASTENEIDAAFATIGQAGVGALFAGTSAFYTSHRRKLVALANLHALPASYHLREFVQEGGLMSYGASDTDAFRRGALYVARILKGEKPAEMPVELPTKYELVINLRTARKLKLEIPPRLRAIADEVIE
jgi:putative tryptophan/tyrosine transport system substrate-binding protein